MSRTGILKYIFCFCGLFRFFGSSGQELGHFDIRTGLEKYPLGSAFVRGDTSLKLVNGGTLEYKSRVETTYFFPGVVHNGYRLAGILFENVLVTYESGKLIRVSFSKPYLKKLDSKFEEKAKQESRQLSGYLTEQWKGRGKKIQGIHPADKLYVVTGRSWKSHDRTMKFMFHERKGSQPSCFIDIILELDGSE